MVKVQDKALIAGAKVIVEEIKQLKPSEDSGALISEIGRTEPEWIKGNVLLQLGGAGLLNDLE